MTFPALHSKTSPYIPTHKSLFICLTVIKHITDQWELQQIKKGGVGE